MRAPIGTDAYMAPEQRDAGRPPRAAGRRLRASPGTLCTALTRRQATGSCGRCRAARRASCRRSCTPGWTRTPPSRPAAAELASALEPLVAALPRRMTLGRRS